MTMTLSNEFNKIRQEFLDAVVANEPQERQAELYGNMLEAMFEESKKVAQREVASVIAHSPAEAKMSARERKFFNEIDKTVSPGLTELIPEETVDRIFEDLTTQHPLLTHIGLKNAGLRLKFIDSDTAGVAEWGQVYGDIKGQLTARFSQSTAIQDKLTAYVVLPKDAERFGPAWVQSFVMTQINEAFAMALETAFLNGDGQDQPLGLAMSLTGTTAGKKTTYKAKKASGSLTFATAQKTVEELTAVYKHHSTKDDGTAVTVEGNLVMVVNPANAWDVKKQYTSLNANGVYVTALPYNLILIESVAQTAGKVTTFVKGRYDAYVAGGIELARYTETLGLEDLNLYTAKQFAYGKARDEKAAAVWNLAVSPATAGTAEPSEG